MKQTGLLSWTMEAYVVHLRRYDQNMNRPGLQRFTFITGDDAVAVEAAFPEDAHVKALATRADPDAWYVVLCATRAQLAETEYVQTLLAHSGLS